MKRKILRLAALTLVCACALSGCYKMPEEEAGALKLYASFYPIYCLTLNMMEEVPDIALYCLTQPLDSCPRSYALSGWDTALLSTADALLMGGRGLESFEAQLSDSALPTATLFAGLSLRNQDATVPEGDDASHLAGANPWLWLSVEGAKQICGSAAAALEAFDPRYAEQYAANLARTQSELDQLLAQMKALLPETLPKTALLHEGLGHLADELGLPIALEIDREPTSELEDREFADALAQLRDSGARLILLEEQAPQRLVSDLEKEGFCVARIDTLTAHTAADPLVYFDVMLENARAIARACA